MRTPARRARLQLFGVRVTTLLLAALLVIAATSLTVRLVRGRAGRPPQVQVLNGSGVPELAQQAARRLRERGVDVVAVGNADAQQYQETLVLLRRGHLGVARQVRDALGSGRVLEQRDGSLLVDVTVILGRDAAPR